MIVPLREGPHSHIQMWAVYRPARVAVCGVEKHRVCLSHVWRDPMAMLMARHGRHRRHDNASSTVALKVGLRVVAALVEDANVRGTLRARQVNATLTSNHTLCSVDVDSGRDGDGGQVGVGAA